jgi:hypothetical protein
MKIGIFYFYNNHIIAPDEYQKDVCNLTRTITASVKLMNPGEHRDLWDNFMVIKYPEIVHLFDDNHKLLPRGRVGFYAHKESIRFLITIDKCIKNREGEIKSIYGLDDCDVEFSYGTLNYQCRDCRKESHL